MPILTKSIKLKTYARIINRLKKLSIFQYQNNEIYDFNILILKKVIPNKKIRIDCICDKCKKHFSVNFNTVTIKNIKKDNILCKFCKQKEYSMKKYGTLSPTQSQIVKDKIKQTNIEKYGVQYSFQSKKVKEKIKNTMIERYRINFLSKNSEIRNKIEETNLKKYGSKSPLQNKDILEKVKKTNLKKYGSTCTVHGNTEEGIKIKEKVKNTLIKKYGVDSIYKSEIIKNKVKQTNLLKYGVENVFASEKIKTKIIETIKNKYGEQYTNASQVPKIKQKQMETMIKNNNVATSKQQIHICNLLNGKLNYSLCGFALDIADIQNKIDIEYDGG